MTFIVTIIVLAGERFFDWSRLRNWQLYLKWQDFISLKQEKMPFYVALALTILPWLVVIGLVNYLLKDVFYGFILLLFQLVVVFYCLGPRNFWADAFSTLNNTEAAPGSSGQHFFPVTFPDQASHSFLDNLFIEANSRLFAVLFWYMVGGLLGAVLYRAVSVSVSHMSEGTSSRVIWIVRLLDWIPVRLMAVLLALGGDFVKVLACLRHPSLLKPAANEKLLAQCGIAALGEQAAQGTLSSQGKSAVSLLDRTFVIALVLAALVSLFSLI